MPATSLNPGESWEEAAKRAAKEKLNVEIEIKKLLSEGEQDREGYKIKLRNYEAELKHSETSDLSEVSPEGTKYEKWSWKPIKEMKEAATETASLCTTLLLNLHNKNFDKPKNIYKIKHL